MGDIYALGYTRDDAIDPYLDPVNPPAGGIPADPLPDDLPEGDSGEVTDEDVPEPVFDPYRPDDPVVEFNNDA